jgi:RelA/SpoT family (p)ppGpp synthetase
MRATGEPYIVHPIAVADLLRDIGAGSSVIAAGFLHDVVEDTQVTPEEIEAQFGAEVRALVEGVTKLGGIHFTNQTEAQAENLRRMFLAMASDIRVVLVKLADRLHNMRTLGALKPEKQQRIARETRDIYAPLANRLGIGRFKWELEDLAFKILEPEAFREIQQQVATKRSEREDRLGVTVQLLRDRLASVGLGSCDVSGRPKHLYGIWSKMQRQQKAFHELYDVAAVRILCPTLESCYRALAVVHDTFRPIPGRFKDYIGLPKPNGYQSLHTAVIGRHRPIEVQIRWPNTASPPTGNIRRGALPPPPVAMPNASVGCGSWWIGKKRGAARTAATIWPQSRKISSMRRCLCSPPRAMWWVCARDLPPLISLIASTPRWATIATGYASMTASALWRHR